MLKLYQEIYTEEEFQERKKPRLNTMSQRNLLFCGICESSGVSALRRSVIELRGSFCAADSTFL
jgi:hypothetical protein